MNDMMNVYKYYKKHLFLFCPSCYETFVSTLYSPTKYEERIDILIDLMTLFCSDYDKLRTTKQVEFELGQILYEIGICENAHEFLKVFEDACSTDIKTQILNKFFKFLNLALIVGAGNGNSSDEDEPLNASEMKKEIGNIKSYLGQSVDENLKDTCEELFNRVNNLANRLVVIEEDKNSVETVNHIDISKNAISNLNKELQSIVTNCANFTTEPDDKMLDSVVDKLDSALQGFRKVVS